ncbi:MAG: tryptophan synthase subunit alpha [Vampirovibrionales bacterium]|nr:tryptophan synthase subunit alpha [Vampirovibrionales bacterium]
MRNPIVSKTNDGRASKLSLMPFTVLGWPTVATSWRIIETLASHGADALELGLPFSEPIADGPVIQAAVTETLHNGFTLADGWQLVARTRAHFPDLPISVLVYTNTVLSMGVEAFYQKAAEVGINAVLVADCPAETAQHLLIKAAHANGISPIFLISPVTDPSRIDLMARCLQPQADRGASFSYWYVVSRLGVTGVDTRYDAALADTLSRLKSISHLPAYVGFGISSPDSVHHMRQLGADGVIVGSKIIQTVREAMARGEAFEPALAQLMQGLSKACQTAASQHM